MRKPSKGASSRDRKGELCRLPPRTPHFSMRCNAAHHATKQPWCLPRERHRHLSHPLPSRNVTTRRAPTHFAHFAARNQHPPPLCVFRISSGGSKLHRPGNRSSQALHVNTSTSPPMSSEPVEQESTPTAHSGRPQRAPSQYSALLPRRNRTCRQIDGGKGEHRLWNTPGSLIARKPSAQTTFSANHTVHVTQRQSSGNIAGSPVGTVKVDNAPSIYRMVVAKTRSGRRPSGFPALSAVRV